MNENEISEKEKAIQNYLDLIDSISSLGSYETQTIELVNVIYDKMDNLKKEIFVLKNKT